VTGGTAGKIAGFKKKNLLSSKIYALPYMQQLAINVCMNEWHVTLERSVVVFSCLVAPFCVKASSVFHVYLSCVFCSFHSWGGHLLVENINVSLLAPLIKHLLLLSFLVFFFFSPSNPDRKIKSYFLLARDYLLSFLFFFLFLRKRDYLTFIFL